MAEVIGIISGVIAIVNLAKPTAKFVGALYEIAKDDGSREHEILSVAEHIESAYETIELARLRLKDNCDRIKAMKYPTSRVAKYIKRGNLKASIRKLTEHFEWQLAKAEKGVIESMSSNFRLVNGMKWYLWINTEMTTIFTTLDRIVMYLSIMGPILELEITTYLLDRAEGETADLLRVHVHSLRDQLGHAERTLNKVVRSKRLQKNHGEDFVAEFEDCATLLVGLSESVRRTGTVPSYNRERKHGERRRRRRHASSQSSSSRDSRSISTSGSTSTSGSSQQAPTTTDCSSVETAPMFTSYRVSDTHHAPPTPPLHIQPSVQSRQTPQTPHMTQIAHTLESSTQTSTNNRSTDVGRQIEGGWIRVFGKSDAPPLKINATIDPRVFGNYIQYPTAQQLNLEIEELDQHDVHHPSRSREINNRVGRVMGKVLGIEWRETRHSKPIMVDFWVTDRYFSSMTGKLIFGNEFAKRLHRSTEIEG
ncbi:hypothetical protein NXS19_007037 [Fusarium pseudograminearum]|nr:hypothetical protein NXS19_007037 [Fusarium pseudograminearum]